MTLDYHCNQCHRPGTTLPDDELSMFEVDKWAPLLACNRCADYLRSKRMQTDRIKNCCEILLQLRLLRESEDTKEAAEKTRQKLVVITKRLTSVVCAHYKQPNVWDGDGQEFVQQLTDNPARWDMIVEVYVRSKRAAPRQLPLMA